MTVRIESSSPGKPLRFFLDESGTGLDQGYLVLGGIAINGEDEHTQALGAWRDLRRGRKGRKWIPNDFQEMTEFLSRHDAHPVACYVKTTPHLLEKLNARIMDLEAARERLGAPKDPRTIAGSWWLWYQLAAQLLGHLVELPRHYGKISSITVSPDPHNAPAWQNQSLVLAASVITRDTARRMVESIGPRTLSPYEIIEHATWVGNIDWDHPVVDFAPKKRSALLEIADGYCSMCLSSLRDERRLASAASLLRKCFPSTHHLFLLDETVPILTRIEMGWEESWHFFRKRFAIPPDPGSSPKS